MLFNSLAFAVFAPVVWIAHTTARRAGWHRLRTGLLLVASYVFYGWFDWRFCGLLALSTVSDHLIARGIDSAASERSRRALLIASVTINLGILAVFKYLEFFAESASRLLAAVGLDASPVTLKVVLPLGISFYTFQTLGYTVDVYRRRIPAERDLLVFATYVAFFPQLVAGPIERAGRLLPQLRDPRPVTAADAEVALGLIVRGYLTKLVIADNLGLVVDRVWADPGAYNGLEVVVAMVAFSFQIYGDFSGYTDIARGVARLFGVDLMENFHRPFLAASPSEFWRRWHVSLSTWLRDYLYVPLGGNRRGPGRTSLNLMVVMVLGGLWHGAAWTFVLWGMYHGVLLVVHRIGERVGAPGPRWVEVPGMFAFTVFGFAIFRSADLSELGRLLARFADPVGPWGGGVLVALIPVCAALAVDALTAPRPAHPLGLWGRPATRGVAYGLATAALVLFSVRASVEFIYFQF